MRETCCLSNCIKVANLSQKVTIILSIRINVLPEDGAMSAETCKSKGDN
jgi:hypothetical protein